MAVEIRGRIAVDLLLPHSRRKALFVANTTRTVRRARSATVSQASDGLSFLGIGVQPPMTSLGNMVGYGRDYIQSALWIMLAPSGRAGETEAVGGSACRVPLALRT